MSRLARVRKYYATNKRAIAVGTAANAILYVPSVTLASGLGALFVGIVGGWAAGQSTHRYGPAIRNGAVVGVLGPVVATLLVVIAGVVTRALLAGDGLYVFGVRLFWAGRAFVPLFVLEGIVGGLAASWLMTAARR